MNLNSDSFFRQLLRQHQVFQVQWQLLTNCLRHLNQKNSYRHLRRHQHPYTQNYHQPRKMRNYRQNFWFPNYRQLHSMNHCHQRLLFPNSRQLHNTKHYRQSFSYPNYHQLHKMIRFYHRCWYPNCRHHRFRRNLLTSRSPSHDLLNLPSLFSVSKLFELESRGYSSLGSVGMFSKFNQRYKCPFSIHVFCPIPPIKARGRKGEVPGPFRGGFCHI